MSALLELINHTHFLIPLAFLTSALTATVGLGGGVLLLAIMPAYMPFSTAILLHGAVQLASNLSRFLFCLKSVSWNMIPGYLLGSALGVGLGYFLIGKIPEAYLPAGLGIFILLIMWTPLLRRFGRWLHQMWLVASIQGFLGLFVGSTGLLSPPILMSHGLSKESVIVTHAVQMSIMHSMKVAAFSVAGVSLLQHNTLTFGMIFASILGCWAGGHMRGWISEEKGKLVLKTLITLLALKLLASSLLS